MRLRARDIHEHLRSAGTWVDWRQGHTCDGFKYGNPELEVQGIAVGWQALQSALEEAQDKGCNLFITHEPTFYSHMDDDRNARQSVPAQRKMAFLERTGMVVYRCHDVWDVFPRLGIVDSWSEFLGLGEPVARAKYYNLHEVLPTTVWELAMRIAGRVAELGEQEVQFSGARWKMARRLAVGTGAITQVQRMVKLGADVVLTTDDGVWQWRDGSWLADLGVPMITVNHMTAEIPGLRNLARYLHEQFSGVPVHFVGPTCSYEIWATQRFREYGVWMRRDGLDDLPPLVLPEGYTCRPMRADEVWAYLEVMNNSCFAGECDQAWFEANFSKDPEYDPSNLMIIWKGDRPVAAAGAWQGTAANERWGVIHWVGAANTERGQGLGLAIVLAALHRLRERGFNRAMLETQIWRLPAIATYMRLGFRPWPTERYPQERWDCVTADMEVWRNSRQS